MVRTLQKFSITQGIANEVRQRTQSRFPITKAAATRAPQLDSFLKEDEPSAGAKAVLRA